MSKAAVMTPMLPVATLPRPARLPGRRHRLMGEAEESWRGDAAASRQYRCERCRAPADTLGLQAVLRRTHAKRTALPCGTVSDRAPDTW
jgi:hypothetical protein